MTTQPMTRIAALLAATTTLVGAFVACGDSITNNANCGAGTRLENGTCVAIPPDATTPVTDGGEEVDSGTTDAGPADTGPDLNAEDPTPDDPCPVSEGPRHFVFNCDAKCGAVDPLCDANFCTRDGTLRPIEKIATGSPSRFTLTAAVLAKTPTLFTNPPTLADKVTIRLPRNAATTLTCVSPAATQTDAAARPLPRFMMFLPMSWQLTQYHQALDTGGGGAETRFVAQFARVRARGFDLQPSHSRLLTRSEDLHFDAMPTTGVGPFAPTNGCVRLDRKALATDQWGTRNPQAEYLGFTGTYIFTDRKLAATNIEADLGYAKDAYSGNVEKAAPSCP